MCDWWSLSSGGKAPCEMPFFGLGYLKNQDNDRSASPLTWGAPPPRCISAVGVVVLPCIRRGAVANTEVNTMSTQTSKAQQARMDNETAVGNLAKRLRKGTKAAVKDLQAILVNASGLGIMHQTLTRIQGAFIEGDAKGMANAIEATYTSKPDRQGRTGESSNLAWLMHIIHGKENPWTPGERTGRQNPLTRAQFAAVKQATGNVGDGLTQAQAIEAGYMTTDGEPITDGVTPEPMADAEMTPIHMTQAQLGDFKAFLEAQKSL